MSVGLYLLKGYACPGVVLLGGKSEGDNFLLEKLINALPKDNGQYEPDFNLLAWRQSGGPASTDSIVMVIFPRRKHRPCCYYKQGETQLLISPGALDMAGLIITPREADFQKLTPQTAEGILREVAFTDEQLQQVAHRLHADKSTKPQPSDETTELPLTEEPQVSVGILRESNVVFTLNGGFSAKGAEVRGRQEALFQDGGIMWNGNLYSELTFCPNCAGSTFTLEAVTIGHHFHWERHEAQTFCGVLHIIVDEEKLVVINRLPVETYLTSVISSEMSATSSVELLKTHAVISRSWLFHQMQQRHKQGEKGSNFFSFQRKENELIKWYDRADHTLFDVCADDHCQRYQGITRADSQTVSEAVSATRGMVIMDEEGHLCDARFSKCCGGATERYSTCWEERDMNYLTPVYDSKEGQEADLSDEEYARQWILDAPPAFCNTHDSRLLSQVLNGYDLETTDFYRWTVNYTQQELAAIIKEKREEDFGEILDLIPVERGASGRIKRLKIVGTKKTLTIGKELEIRRALSPSHLYSSAFIVEKAEGESGIPRSFTLRGAGWGHGVGLCQIGAASMSEQGFDFREILAHYYKHTVLKKLYK